MADEIAFIEVRAPSIEQVFVHTGYKSMMRQFANAEFRAATKGQTLEVKRSGKPFMKVVLDD